MIPVTKTNPKKPTDEEWTRDGEHNHPQQATRPADMTATTPRGLHTSSTDNKWIKDGEHNHPSTSK